MVRCQIPNCKQSVQGSLVVIEHGPATKDPAVRARTTKRSASFERASLGDSRADLCRQSADATAICSQQAGKGDGVGPVRSPLRKLGIEEIDQVVIVPVANCVVQRPYEALALDDYLLTIRFIGIEGFRLGRVSSLNIEAGGVPKCRLLDRIQMVDEWLNESVLAAARFRKTPHRQFSVSLGASNGS